MIKFWLALALFAVIVGYSQFHDDGSAPEVGHTQAWEESYSAGYGEIEQIKEWHEDMPLVCTASLNHLARKMARFAGVYLVRPDLNWTSSALLAGFDQTGYDAGCEDAKQGIVPDSPERGILLSPLTVQIYVLLYAGKPIRQKGSHHGT